MALTHNFFRRFTYDSSIPDHLSQWRHATRRMFYRNTTQPDQRQPAIVITGSWLTVKEQMAHEYASKLAALGYTVFTFDFAGFGQSGGDLRQTEIPARKISDIIAAVDFVRTMSFVQPGAVGYLGICASAQSCPGGDGGRRANRFFVSVAGWFHDAVSVTPFYGSPEGADDARTRRQATVRFLSSGETELAPAYRKGDRECRDAFELDYYANHATWSHPGVEKRDDVMTWCYWLMFDGLMRRQRSTPRHCWCTATSAPCGKCPANPCELRAKKRLVWSEGSQIDFYDQPALVGMAVELQHEHFRTLRFEQMSRAIRPRPVDRRKSICDPSLRPDVFRHATRHGFAGHFPARRTGRRAPAMSGC